MPSCTSWRPFQGFIDQRFTHRIPLGFENVLAILRQ
jgi:hypothetical protein